MLWRTIDDELDRWKAEKTKQALLLTGARQIGKTTAVRAFAKRSYRNLAEVNFVETPAAAKTLAQASNTADLLMRLSVLTGTELVPGQTLLFLDEVQECRDMITWVKFLEERTGLDVVLSGSLLGIDAFSHVRSLPVGFLQKMRMHPLTFQEFSRACGIARDAWNLACEAVRDRALVPDYLHDRLMELFRTYVLVGGLPDAVQKYVDTNQIVPVRNVQQAVFDMYEEDIAKYVEDPVEARQIRMVFEAIPGQLNAPSKRFKYARLGKDLRFANMETAFDWLNSAGVANVVTRVGEPSFPLGLSEDRNAFKLFMGDVGLLCSRLMGTVALDVLNNEADINYGSVYENAVCQQLVAMGFAPHYYYSKRIGEVDFCVEDLRNGTVCLVEVKSGKGYKRHSALTNLLRQGSARVRAVVLCDSNVERKGDRDYLPLYAAGMRCAYGEE